MHRLLLILSALLLPFFALAQEDEDMEIDVHNIKPEVQDVELPVIKCWKLDQKYYNMVPLSMDTALDAFQIFNPVIKEYFSATHLGNLGQATISNLFFLRKYNSDFVFFQPHEVYSLTPENTIYYNTRKQFTLVEYSNGGKKGAKEQSLKVLHTQNVNPFLNVGFRYNVLSSVGEYSNQSTKIATVGLFSNYQKERYEMHLSLNYNKFKLIENGGLKSNNLFENDAENSDLDYYFTGGTYPRSIVQNNTAQIIQKYKIGKNSTVMLEDSLESKIFKVYSSIGHKVRYETSYRLYEDNNPDAGLYKGQYVDENSMYYNDSLANNYNPDVIPIFIDEDFTFDSVKYRSLKNELFIELPENTIFKPGGRLAIGNDIDFLNFNAFEEAYFSGVNARSRQMSDTNLISYYLSLSASKRFGEKFDWNVLGKYYPLGYKKGDIEFDGSVERKINGKTDTSSISLDVSFRSREPEFFENYYFCNNYKWDSSYVKKQQTDICLTFSKPKWYLEAGIYYGIVDNYIYYEYTGYPKQETSTFNVQTVFIKKEFRYWKMRNVNNFFYQNTDNKNALRIPEIVLNSSIFFDNNFHFKSTNGELHLQLGVDFYYCSKYNAFSYIPATNKFVMQYENEIGGHPVIDPFINIRIKRVRFFMKFTHLNALFMASNYYTASIYPMNRYAMKFGISWSFYD